MALMRVSDMMATTSTKTMALSKSALLLRAQGPGLHPAVRRCPLGPDDGFRVACPQIDGAAFSAHPRRHLRRDLVGAEPVHEAQRSDDRHRDPAVDPLSAAGRTVLAGHAAGTCPRPATTGWPSRRRSCSARSCAMVVLVSISTSS